MRRLVLNVALFLAVLLGATLAHRVATDYWEDGGAVGPIFDALLIGPVSAAAVLLSPVAFYLMLEGIHYEDGLGSLAAVVAGWLPALVYGAIVRVEPREHWRPVAGVRRM